MRVAVVGLGRVQFGPAQQSHLEVLTNLPGATIAALVDPVVTAQAVARRWPGLAGQPVLPSLDALPAGVADVVALCTPPQQRLSLVHAALALEPRVIVVEKPVALSAEEAAEIDRLCCDAGVALRINFHRRFDPEHRRLREAVPGVPAKAVLRYSKGLYNDCSHLLDLLLDWFGPISWVQATEDAQAPTDSPDFLVGMAAGFTAHVIGLPGLGYDQFEGDFFFHGRVARLANGGFVKQVLEARADLHTANYNHLDLVANVTKPTGGLADLYQAIRTYLETGAPLGGCRGSEALQGIHAMDAVARSAAGNHERIALPTGIQI